MKITPVRSGKADFLAMYRKMFAEASIMNARDLSRLYNLRCSALPYCPRSVLAEYGLKGKFMSMDMSMGYYTSVGTAVHTVMQTFLALSGQFLADYECKICGKKYPLSHTYECCDHPTQYEEVSIDVGTKRRKVKGKVQNILGIQGHIDGIFKDNSGRYWIVDFKTCTVAGASSKERSPPDTYTRQVGAYAVLLRKQYGITVAGAMLVFIPRDNPRPEQIKIWEKVLSEKDFDLARAELIVDRSLHKKTMKAETMREIMELAKTKCGSAFCDYCKMDGPSYKKLASRFKKLPILGDL